MNSRMGGKLRWFQFPFVPIRFLSLIFPFSFVSFHSYYFFIFPSHIPFRGVRKRKMQKRAFSLGLVCPSVPILTTDNRRTNCYEILCWEVLLKSVEKIPVFVNGNFTWRSICVSVRVSDWVGNPQATLTSLPCHYGYLDYIGYHGYVRSPQPPRQLWRHLRHCKGKMLRHAYIS
jgi:hypothetical protein